MTKGIPTETSEQMRLLELAERCEKAAGPDERLNAEIVAALNNALLKPYPPQTDFGPGQRWQFWSLDGAHFLGNEAKHPFKVLPFTASLDAAITLVPEDAWWSVMRSPCADGYDAEVASDDHRHAATHSLALCAAALRARAAQIGDQQ